MVKLSADRTIALLCIVLQYLLVEWAYADKEPIKVDADFLEFLVEFPELDDTTFELAMKNELKGAENGSQAGQGTDVRLKKTEAKDDHE